MAEYAAYIRRSTYQQENKHQLQAIKDWLQKNEVEPSEVEYFQETASGASRNREQLRELMQKIKDNEVRHVVIWELSRIAREGKLAQEFFDLAEDNNVTIHVTSGSIRRLEPDGSNRFVADILAAVYAEERRTLIRRTKYGQQRALKEDKWIGRPPIGFTTTTREENMPDGYLMPNLDPNEDEDGFWAVKEALEKIDSGKWSYREAGRKLNTPRQSLMQIHKNEDKLKIYRDFEANDSRIKNALELLNTNPD